mmetsp:Transcript_43587/g.102743  ORF Transcript_43587/g.102743 Transcript_43587/m.102743 type:complete len:672 (-) Transcript_43587:96-2111(-)
MERSLLSRILFPVLPPSYTVDSFPHDLIWVPRSRASVNLLELSQTFKVDKCTPHMPPEEYMPEDTSPEDHVPCLLLTYPSARFLIIFFHSNAEDLGRCHGFCSYLREQFQVHVLAVEYPGYGICPGVPTGESVMENARAALYFAMRTLAWPLDSIKIFGRSIGTGPAIGLASLFSFAGVILVTPFLSIQELFRDRLGPLGAFVEEWFGNKELMPTITSPTMIIHGQRDELISCRHGEVLYELLTSRKLLISPPEMEHNTNLLTNLQFFVLPMFQFFALPDYTFQDLVVPAWAYDKRRCPSYVRPQVEIASNQAPRNADPNQIMSVPRGDNGDLPLPAHNSDQVPAPTQARPSPREVEVKDPLMVNMKPETREAMQRLEEFAGKLCTEEICSDKLCEVAGSQVSNPNLQRQEQELDRIVRSRNAGSSSDPPVAPRLLAKRHRGTNWRSRQSSSIWGNWCSRGIVEQEEDDEIHQPTRQFSGDSPRLQGAFEEVDASDDVRTSPSSPKPLRTDSDWDSWRKRTGGMTEEEHVRARWARRNAAQKSVGRRDAPGLPPPMGGPDDLPSSAGTDVGITRMMSPHEEGPPSQRQQDSSGKLPIFTACCNALPSDPASGSAGNASAKRVVGIGSNLEEESGISAAWGGSVIPPRGTMAADYMEEAQAPVFCSMVPWRR